MTMAEENKDQYVVLARKYRPQSFDDLLGQDALVQTLTNAIQNNRLHHAYMLTGIRGVGKTTTARIIAKALNCTGPDGKGGPTVHPCGVCENCKAIAADRHIDVMELDAASRTGVDDIREILDGVRYKPTNARYKIYIIDEVHMLSKNAFNALLKTLEEPPSHVKFIFATTEIRKVPVTVLSRCQRFDLQRLTIDTLFNHFKNIIGKEGLQAEDEALKIIAKAADGSCRDGLSLLDQAISLSAGGIVKTDIVKNMIGLADRNQTFELFKQLAEGKTEDMLANLQEQYRNGANPVTILQDLVNITHMIAKTKIIPAALNGSDLSESEKELCTKLGPKIPIAVLSKIWQMLLKGIAELSVAPVQIDAVEMILIRIAYAAGLPTPYELLNDVKKNSSLASPLIMPEKKSADDILKAVGSGKKISPVQIDVSNEVPAGDFLTFSSPEQLVDYLENNKKMLLAYSLKNDVSISEFRDGYIKMTLDKKADTDFIMALHKMLLEVTGKQWKIDSQHGDLGVTLAAKERAQDEEAKKDIMEYPLVKAIMAEFKGARIETMTRNIIEDEQNSLLNSFDDELGENEIYTNDEE